MEHTAKKSILVVDDNTTTLKNILEILKDAYRVFPASSGEQALGFLENHTPDLILLDIEMPGVNGYEVLEQIKAHAEWGYLPVIFLTGVDSRDYEEQALGMGAVDYILKPVVAGVVLRRVQLHLELKAYRESLEELVEVKTAQLTRTQDAILEILANVTAFRDNETGAHIQRTTEYTRILVDAIRQADLPGYEIDDLLAKNIIKSAKLHDIGKVAIADSILLKPDRLTPAEFDRIKTHTTFGAMMIESAMQDIGEESAFLSTAKELVLTHHECWDGTGYPNGLAGEEIPLSGRIMAIADVYDALISNRPYKSAFTHENAMSILNGEAGTHFDERLIKLCQDIYPQFAEVANAITDDSSEEFRAWF